MINYRRYNAISKFTPKYIFLWDAINRVPTGNRVYFITVFMYLFFLFFGICCLQPGYGKAAMQYT